MTRGQVLIAGMFRSGTTLLSRLLGDHPQGLMISDPFVYFFKHYRDFHLNKLRLTDWHAEEPTPDYFGGARRELLEALFEADLQEELPTGCLEQMIADIRRWKTRQHPELCARLDDIKARTFAEVYSELMALAVEIHGDDEVAIAGTKVSWCEEFLPAMARAFPKMRFVLPVRDLRAIVASQNSKQGLGVGHRPLLFYVRHWRKSVALTQYYAKQHSVLRGRVKIVRYEDLVRQPETVLGPLLEHIGLRPHVSCSPRGGTDGAHNSSFEQSSTGVFTGSIERWRTTLNTDEIAAIEAFAGPELSLLGYQTDPHPIRPLACLETSCEPRFEQVASWLQPFAAAAYLRDESARAREYAAEERRIELIESEGVPALQEELDAFLVPGHLCALRGAWRQ